MKFQGDILNFCDFIQVFVFTTNHHLKFYIIRFRYYFIMANCTNLNQFKGYSSCATKARLTKLDVHHIIIVIHIQYKFHEIPFSGYLVMAPDGRTDGHGQNYIPPAFGGNKNDTDI